MVKLSVFLGLIICFTWQLQAQTSWLTLKATQGELIVHKDAMSHLANYPISGFRLSFEKTSLHKTNWMSRYNYPNYGVVYSYQDMGSPALGTVHSLSGFYKFFFLKRRLYLTSGVGLGYTTNPFDAETNPKNIAYGSAIMANVLFELMYQSQVFWDQRFCFEAGLFFQHLSNARVKSPNSGSNHYGLQVGLTYRLIDSSQPKLTSKLTATKNDFTAYQSSKPFSFSAILATGFNDLEILNTNAFPLVTFTALAEKRLGFKSSVQLGSDFFYSEAAQEYNKFRAAAYPEEGVTEQTDANRIGVFMGHRLHLGHLKLVSQLGYYVYYPSDYLKRIYTRLGLQYKVSEKWFASMLLKTHFAQAEALEVGIGFKL